jgi:hypothetical protein
MTVLTLDDERAGAKPRATEEPQRARLAEVEALLAGDGAA